LDEDRALSERYSSPSADECGFRAGAASAFVRSARFGNREIVVNKQADDAANLLADLKREVELLKTRVRELEDDREIRELLARYGFLADQGLDEEFVGLFTDDGEMELTAPGVRDKVVGWRGHDGLLSFITGQDHKTDPHLVKAEGRRMHGQGNNLRTYIDGDVAVAESYSLVLTKGEDGKIDLDGGSNRWTLHRVDGRWKIRKRMRRGMGMASFHEAYVTKS
jgi:hypothetical protein